MINQLIRKGWDDSLMELNRILRKIQVDIANLKTQSTTTTTVATNNTITVTAAVTAVGSFNITANVNDFPFGDIAIAKLYSDGIWDMTGAEQAADGKRILLVNAQASGRVVLKHESTSSLAPNRFNCQGSADVTLRAGFGAEIVYDLDAGRWRVYAL